MGAGGWGRGPGEGHNRLCISIMGSFSYVPVRGKNEHSFEHIPGLAHFKEASCRQLLWPWESERGLKHRPCLTHSHTHTHTNTRVHCTHATVMLNWECHHLGLAFISTALWMLLFVHTHPGWLIWIISLLKRGRGAPHSKESLYPHSQGRGLPTTRIYTGFGWEREQEKGKE